LKINPDTNVLLRAIVGDDQRQARIAQTALARADVVTLTLPALCELAWVMKRGYGFGAPDIAEAIRGLIDSENVVVNRGAVEAGLSLMDAGGDFADAVIANEGRWLGAELFVTFDRRAARLMEGRGEAVRLLS
jgi:predicted nucleic-acid-binding protein